MVSGLTKLGVGAIAVVGVLVLSPAAALADSCGGGSSAVNIYSECIQTAGGGKHRAGSGTKTTPTTATNTSTPYVVTPVTVSKKVQRSIAHAGRDRKLLHKLVTDPSLGATQAFVVPASYRAKTPSALGAVVDLGSGPNVLFAMLAAIAIVLLGVGGFHSRRQRQP